ncbi:MAG: hypothetical protein NTY64_06100, partial [Deltaproteobacteria bacterium]|nr:hypothetical protein [Deltaproteobacteria bacterium]
MKKYFVVLVAAVAILAVASPSLAQFKSWGHMEVETYWSNKGTYFDSDKSDNRRAIAERFRFYLQYGDPKTVRAVIGFEADSTTWGESSGPSAPYLNNNAAQGSNNAGTTTGAPGATDRNHMGSLATDQIALEIKHAYLDFVVPNTPLSVMAGLQNFAVGGSLGRFWENVDAPGIQLSGNFAPHTIQAVYFKEYKGNTYKD